MMAGPWMMHQGRYRPPLRKEPRDRCFCECHHHLSVPERPQASINRLCERCFEDAYAPWPVVLDSLPR